ncbi:heme peroxidase [Aspergillus undulatus]|uniref:heme peroxidase n=1 Tax=Aspergillus undulatus TaxID=1810928 RepID=UPI003CCDB693
MSPFMQNGSDTDDLSSSPAPSKSKPSALSSLLGSLQADLVSQAHRIPADFRTLREISQAGLNGGLIDDRKYVIENAIQVASSLPNTSGLRTKITDAFIASLWNNLQHPPLSYLSDEFRYRRADGSFNNVMYPHLGASGSHYARNVTTKHPRPAVLPDPGFIFNTLFAREGPAKKHPTHISSNLIYFATIIQHDLYHTDEALFQTGRLITCALYVSIILNDYLRTILNLNAGNFNSDWKIDPRKSLSVFDSEGLPRGMGNQVSAEFNMMYHWHAAMSNHDENWVNELTSKVFGQRLMLERCPWNASTEPSSWTFGNFMRGKDGKFADGDVVRLLQSGCENAAGTFGAHNTPKVMRAIETLGIQRGREWELATLNEVRMFFKLKPHRTFAEVNSDPSVAEALEALYGHPDNIELYVGVQAEAPFYSDQDSATDSRCQWQFSPTSLRLVKIAESDFDVASGGLMYKLLMRAFPGWYAGNSAYALYPFTTPVQTQHISMMLTGPELDFKRPICVRLPVQLGTSKGVDEVLKDRGGDHILKLTKRDYMLGGDALANAEQRTYMAERMYRPTDAIEQIKQFYENITADLIWRTSKKLGDSYQVDLVRDVARQAHFFSCAEYFNIPLKGTLANSTNIQCDAYNAHELSDALCAIYGYIFLDNDSGLPVLVPVNIFSGATKIFGRYKPLLAGYGLQLIKRPREGSKSVEEVVWMVILTAAKACGSQIIGWSQLLDLYLSDDYAHHWPAIRSLAQSDEPEAFKKLKKYALEGFRLSPALPGTYRTATCNTTLTEPLINTPHTISKNSSIFVDISSAGMGASIFPDPEKVKLNRPLESYIHHGTGQHSCLGRAIVTTAGAF